ncbi:mitochondrial hinge protein, putative [Trypanosoma brucei gambiense DAL972]|uniref:Mitochondrial hinge protein, putative n=1 Tax=Trypanosoma brucei gambiense (strain MHOM/CI/86/DAL972) TaxID=679716 RepID=C9ZWN6_TRYB9|nr:mitochondrial hinge protein, putative [Trypanosoma brucei gambiense DAL972]CBH13825.1 mitochondrial hinge protein, putative [Trypanosoma brucei gambiense DAL972]|eukprot:XP_011776101.1 mitochondrial hinge protein, putative [Trypanosoma brucei gambiense DAL972]
MTLPVPFPPFYFGDVATKKRFSNAEMQLQRDILLPSLFFFYCFSPQCYSYTYCLPLPTSLLSLHPPKQSQAVTPINIRSTVQKKKEVFYGRRGTTRH